MKKLILIITLILSLQINTLATTLNGEIKGKVFVNRNPCTTAAVVLIDQNMKTTVQYTNSQGYYSFENLSIGKYVITVKVNNKFFVKYKLVQ